MERKNGLRNLVLSITGIVALFLAFGGSNILRNTQVGVSPEVRSYAETQLVIMDGQHFRDQLAAAGDRPTLAFVYASWCPWCKKQFPIIHALRQRFPEEQLQVIYVSIDRDIYDLSAFLMETQPQRNFTAYHSTGDNLRDFYGTLSDHGFHQMGSVPYLILLDKHAKRVGEFLGLTQVERLIDAVKKAQGVAG